MITSHPGLPSYRVEEGLPILRLPRPGQGRLLRRLYEPYLTHVPLSYAALRAGDYDLAHAVHPPDALAAARWRRVTGRPALLSYLGVPDHAGLLERRGRLELIRSALRGCDAVVALSRYAADAFERWLGYQAPVIAPGVDVRAFKPAAARCERPTIVCAADVAVPRKHVGLLVQAFGLIRGELPDARLVLSRPRDLDAVRSAGVDLGAPGVQWAELDDRATLGRAYGEAWVAVLPARDEAFGLVLAEALACGTPVVGYDHGGIPEVIDRPGIGRLFDRLDAPTLAQAMLETIQLCTDPATATQTAQRCRARGLELSSDRCTERYLELYRELGAHDGAAPCRAEPQRPRKRPH